MIFRASILPLLFAAAAIPAAAQEGDAFTQKAVPLLDQYCYSCHGEKKQKGGIELHHLLTTEAAFRQHRFLETMLKQVESGDMPPDDEDRQPSPEQRAALVDELQSVLQRLAAGDYPRNPGRPTLRRLNRNEYTNTVRDLFGVDFQAGADFPADGAGGEGFDNVGDSLFLPPSLMEKYLAAAKRIVAKLYADPALKQRVLSTQPSDSADPSQAAKSLLTAWTAQAFRRQITGEDTTPLVTIFNQGLASGKTYEEALRLPLQALLVHPSFLFRVEADQEDKSEWRISDYELATRLSYFLWASMPDGPLLKLAEEGKLSDPAVLHDEVTRMLQDPKALSLGRFFAGQWLGFDELREFAQPDPKRFPTFTPSLRVAMYRESVDFFNYLVSANRPATELIKANYTFVNAELARHYGIPGIEGDDLRKVDLSDPQRGGIIGQASVLVTTSQPLRTSPVKRGKWILDTLLDTPPPPPPPDAGVLPGDDHSAEGLTFRQQLEAHRTRATCAACHAKIDPLGFGLENFDAIGRWRTTDANGKPVDSAATLPGGRSFSTPAELKEVVLSSGDLFLRNLCRKLLAYSLGRPLEYYDEAVVTDLVAKLRAGDLKMQTLIFAIVDSQPFQYRSANR